MKEQFITTANIPQAQSFTEADMRAAWARMEAEDTLRFLFYDGEVRSVDAYIDFMTDPTVYAYLVRDEATGEPLLTYFVNNFIGHTGLIHFCFFNAGKPHMPVLGRRAAAMLLSPGHLSALIGITPKPFRHAWRYALSLGFKHVATLPDACFLATGHRMADAVVTLCRPEDLTTDTTTDKEE